MSAPTTDSDRVGPSSLALLNGALERIPPKATESQIAGEWIVEPRFQPTPSERTFTTPFVVVQTTRQGCAYIPTTELQHVRDFDLVGRIASECVATAPLPLQVALVDALLAEWCPEDVHSGELHLLDGTVRDKATQRAKLVATEAERMHGLPAAVALVGYSGEIRKALSHAGFAVRSYDLDYDVLSGEHQPVSDQVLPGPQFYSDPRPDLVVATGMTLCTNTLGSLSAHCVLNEIPMLLYCQTAPSLAVHLLSSCGLRAVVAEHIPFYNWEGISPVRIHRSDK